MAMKQASAVLLPSDRFVIVMVGLPARGKSYMGKKIARYMRHLNIIAKIFNCGSYRRIATKNDTVGKASAKFFDPDNAEAVRIRTQCCLDAMNDMCSWFKSPLNAVGILDATNTTLERRQLVREFFGKKQYELEFNVKLLHCESICNDQSVIDENIIRAKLKNPDYCTVDKAKAISDFNKRIEMYKKQYTPVQKNEGSYIKVIDVGVEVTGYALHDYISCRILYFLTHLHLHSQHQKVTETSQPSLLARVGSSSSNSDDTNDDNHKSVTISPRPASTFASPNIHRPVQTLAPWMKRESFRMWSDPENTYMNHPKLSLTPTSGSTKGKSSPFISGSATSITSPTSLSPFKSSPVRSQPMIQKKKSVRRATLVINSIQERNAMVTSKLIEDPIENESSLITIKENEVSVNQSESSLELDTDHSGFGTENEEEFELATVSEHKEDDDTFTMTANPIFCELCGRSVEKRDTALVESKDDEEEKVRICQVCLYETDSEDDETEEDEAFMRAPLSVSPNPSVFDSSSSTNEQENKVKEISQGIDHLLGDLEKEHDDKHIKEELLKLKEGISLMFHGNSDRLHLSSK